jgi:hypothetical protein
MLRIAPTKRADNGDMINDDYREKQIMKVIE